jgi:hypothetical protein
LPNNYGVGDILKIKVNSQPGMAWVVQHKIKVNAAIAMAWVMRLNKK